MTSEQHSKHVEPLRWLVAHKLHPNKTLAQRVREMRYRRRKAKVEPIIETSPNYDTSLAPTTHET